ncbi:MAG: hypothetical protein WCR02_00815 [Sphaerochaetaceae bacterium]|jgi:Rad3-related DNA helicase
MRCIKSACLLETICFSNVEELENYKELLEKRKRKFVIDSLDKDSSGALVVKFRRQCNEVGYGSYLD